jgi:tRNA dimethylallyltransferase
LPLRRAPVLAIFGPTASGKSDVAEALAKRIPAELVSADAMQVYRGVPLLTNQSDHETHLVGIWPLAYEASVGEYQELAHETIDAIMARGKTPIVVGGTGLYLRAAIADLSLEKAAPGEDSELWSEETRHPTVLIGLNMDRAQLYERIERRVEEIVAGGAEQEARTAEAAGPSHTARKALGFDELLAGDISALKQRSRNYARRQLAWMRKMAGLREFDVTGLEPREAAARVAEEALR